MKFTAKEPELSQTGINPRSWEHWDDDKFFDRLIHHFSGRLETKSKAQNLSTYLGALSINVQPQEQASEGDYLFEIKKALCRAGYIASIRDPDTVDIMTTSNRASMQRISL